MESAGGALPEARASSLVSRVVEVMPPASFSSHWSGVAKGKTFFLTLKYELYRPDEVCAAADLPQMP